MNDICLGLTRRFLKRLMMGMRNGVCVFSGVGLNGGGGFAGLSVPYCGTCSGRKTGGLGMRGLGV